MSLPVIEIYSDLQCPWAYLACYRLRQVWPPYEGRVQLVWRALSLEYINQRGTSKPLLGAELALIQQLEPTLPLQPWQRPDWQWSVTAWPAFELLASTQAHGSHAAFELNWALREAFFADSRSLSLRHELLEIVRNVARRVPFDLERVIADWDAGRYKGQVLADSERGWHTLELPGSPTFVLPDGTWIHNPGGGDANIDEVRAVVRSYTPPAGDPLATIRELLERTVQHGAPSGESGGQVAPMQGAEPSPEELRRRIDEDRGD